jgi:hypothetical protein
MSQVLPFQASMHRQADRLLPWLVNGTLEGEQLEQVQRHLGSCARCQQEARDLQRLQRLYRGLEAPPPAPEAFERLRRRLPPGYASDRGSAWRAWRTRAGRAWRGAPPVLRWTLAAQLLLVAALGLAQWRVEPAATPAYRTLGAPAAITSPGQQLVVVFEPGLSEARMRALLRASGARIIDGPSEAGAYVLVLPADRVAAVQARLRGASGVLLVERLQRPAEP